MYVLYEVINNINEKYYVGVHKTDNENDCYYGSGIAIKRAIKKYGKHNFTKRIIARYETSEEAYEHEKNLVNKDFINDRMSYNMNIGGKGGFEYINSMGLSNPMSNPETITKCIENAKITRAKNPEKYRKIAIENFKKASEINTGKKRPEHSKIMKELGKNPTEKMIAGWKSAKETSKKIYVLVDLCGVVKEFIGLYELKKYCKENNLPHSSVYNIIVYQKEFSWGKVKGYSGYIKNK